MLALETRQANSIAHRLLLAAPSRVLRVSISHGQKVSIPKEEKGGLGVSRSGGI